jgi:ABC-type cobalamin/Fe3+-siderophores transport system ATPase subunit
MNQPIIDKLYKRYNNKTIIYPYHAEIFPKPLMCYIVGQTGSGKTTLLVDFLLKEGILDYNDVHIYTKTSHQKHYVCLKQYYKDHIDALNLYYFSKENKTLPTREIYNSLKQEFTKFVDFVKAGVQPNDQIVYFYDKDDEILDPSKLDPNKSHIIVFDDVLSEKQNKMRDYFTRGRHNKNSVFYLSQSFYKVAKHCIRDNVNLYIIFKQNNKNLESFYKDQVDPDMKFDEFKEFCNKAWCKEHGYVMINCDKLADNGKYRINCDEIYVPKNS